jgi:hypothetical protein
MAFVMEYEIPPNLLNVAFFSLVRVVFASDAVSHDFHQDFWAIVYKIKIIHEK